MATSEKQTQWKNMREFYSITLHWPSMDTLNFLQQGTLLIVWMQQQIPPADARLQTYAWNEHLATDSQIERKKH